MIPGIQLSNGATTITVAPMNLRIQFDESTQGDVDLVMRGAKDDPKAFQHAAINVILACARRNHPTLSREQLLDVLDYADLGPLLVSVLTKSGFAPRPLATSATAMESLSHAPASLDNSSTQQDGSLTTSSTASPGETSSS